ncbi:TRAP-type mannitol/chloroaromatic compound transport system, periplasmic component [Shewanella psychrophila]|uniref:TRAP-type mannitol/chloroaromatic compound transport system, periplasmic component n=1 Tax=Shewanella psychrophila TaxID=225848 RepID=A0A1S6HVF9_9GAMM|nr:TRAP transporter substrate-binding protein DctP [Shewanella psychrophila]AQS39408.1 TRAP-type mannitol/chloroaromatic compound transport system, periplasmic component [Shewanella psychrophila]
MSKLRLVLIVMTGLLLNACGGESKLVSVTDTAKAEAIEWKLVTSWPKNFPGLGMGPERFALLVDEMSNGRLKIKVYGAGELMPAFEVFDAVSQGTVQMGHSAAYYWKGKTPAAQFFTSIPFGLNAQEMNGWLHYGGGMELWEEVYEPFGILPLAGGNTGVQMGGWFNKEINSMADLKGLKMRLPGLGGEVLKRVGGVPVTLPGRELYTALQTGAIDATEWVGPFNDLAFGLHKAAKFYYYPGWHEPGTTLEFIINKQAFANLSGDLQAIVRVASRAINQDMLDEYTSKHVIALESLINEHDVIIKQFPDEVMKALAKVSKVVIKEQSQQDDTMKKVYDAYMEYQAGVRKYHLISEDAYSRLRQ